jgi:hypothetical protein
MATITIYNPRGRTTKEMMGFASAVGTPGTAPEASAFAALVPFYTGALGELAEMDNTAWPNAATTTEVDLGIRVRFDFRGFTVARLQGVVIEGAPSGAKIAVQFSTDDGTTWNYLDGADGPWMTVSAAGDVYGPDITLVPAAQADVLLRLVARGS